MSTLSHSATLLRTLCDLIKDPGEAARISALDPADDETFTKVYLVVRNLPSLTPVLRDALVAEIVERTDRETERLLADQGPRPSPVLARVIPLQRRRRFDLVRPAEV